MKLFTGPDGRLDYDEITSDVTVQDLLDAVEAYLEGHPLPCFSCKESCCRKPWAVEVDNVFVRRLTGGDGEAAGRFVRQKLKLKLNHSMEFNQYVLDKAADCPYILADNHCGVYGIRPVICRLYVCPPKGRRYDLLRGAIAATFLQALVTEEKMRRCEPSPGTLRRYRRNPALFAKDYDILLRDILDYAQWAGWLDGEDRRML